MNTAAMYTGVVLVTSNTTIENTTIEEITTFYRNVNPSVLNCKSVNCPSCLSDLFRS